MDNNSRKAYSSLISRLNLEVKWTQSIARLIKQLSSFFHPTPCSFFSMYSPSSSLCLSSSLSLSVSAVLSPRTLETFLVRSFLSCALLYNRHFRKITWIIIYSWYTELTSRSSIFRGTRLGGGEKKNCVSMCFSRGHETRINRERQTKTELDPERKREEREREKKISVIARGPWLARSPLCCVDSCETRQEKFHGKRVW